jgi:hypothetical protein
MEVRYTLSNDAKLTVANGREGWRFTQLVLDIGGRLNLQMLEPQLPARWLDKRFTSADRAVSFIERKIRQGRLFNWRAEPLAQIAAANGFTVLDGSPAAIFN